MAIITQTQQIENRFSWIYLSNLIFYILPVFFVPYDAWQLVMVALALVVFLLCYFWVYRIKDRHVWLPILGMWAVASAITPLNYGSIAIFAYVGFFTGMCYRLAVALTLLLLQVAWIYLLSTLIDLRWSEFFLYGAALNVAVFCIGVVEHNRQLAMRRDAQSASEIQQLAQQLERERIARDLHDLLGHSLSSIVLKAELASKLLARDNITAAKEQLEELESISRESLQQVRSSVTGYRHQGLTVELQRLTDRLREQNFAVDIKGQLPALQGLRETTLVMALTELITNVLRHSRGTKVGIDFTSDNRVYEITVKDNGNPGPVTPGNGLSGLEERLQLIGGSMTIATEPCTRATLTIPKEAVTL